MISPETSVSEQPSTSTTTLDQSMDDETQGLEEFDDPQDQEDPDVSVSKVT